MRDPVGLGLARREAAVGEVGQRCVEPHDLVTRTAPIGRVACRARGTVDGLTGLQRGDGLRGGSRARDKHDHEEKTGAGEWELNRSTGHGNAERDLLMSRVAPTRYHSSALRERAARYRENGNHSPSHDSDKVLASVAHAQHSTNRRGAPSNVRAATMGARWSCSGPVSSASRSHWEADRHARGRFVHLRACHGRRNSRGPDINSVRGETVVSRRLGLHIHRPRQRELRAADRGGGSRLAAPRGAFQLRGSRYRGRSGWATTSASAKRSPSRLRRWSAL